MIGGRVEEARDLLGVNYFLIVGLIVRLLSGSLYGCDLLVQVVLRLILSGGLLLRGERSDVPHFFIRVLLFLAAFTELGLLVLLYQVIIVGFHHLVLGKRVLN